jgi:hypothetical protein
LTGFMKATERIGKQGLSGCNTINIRGRAFHVEALCGQLDDCASQARSRLQRSRVLLFCSLGVSFLQHSKECNEGDTQS